MQRGIVIAKWVLTTWTIALFSFFCWVTYLVFAPNTVSNPPIVINADSLNAISIHSIFYDFENDQSATSSKYFSGEKSFVFNKKTHTDFISKMCGQENSSFLFNKWQIYV